MPPPTAAEIAARLDRLPSSRTVWTMVVLLSLGGFFEFYDMFFTGYVGPGHGEVRHLDRDHARSVRRARSRSRASAPSCSRRSSGPLGGHRAVRLRGRPVRPAHDLHRVADLVHGPRPRSWRSRPPASGSICGASSPASGIGVELVTIDAYHRRTGARVACAAAPSRSTRSCTSAPCRSWRCWRGCWCRWRRSGSTAGAGWCWPARWARWSCGSCRSAFPKARAGWRSTDGSRKPTRSSRDSRRRSRRETRPPLPTAAARRGARRRRGALREICRAALSHAAR